MKAFFSIAHFRHSIKWADVFASLMEKLAYGEEIAEWSTSEDGDFWKCGFCGYANTYSSYSCKSCGKERIKKIKEGR